MLKSIAMIFILVCFALVCLVIILSVVVSLAVSAAALLYRLAGRSNVPLMYNLRNMAVRWKNTVVTMAAFIVVIGLVVFMLAFVNGMNKLTETSGRAGNVMLLQDGATDEVMSNLPPTADVLRLPTDVRRRILTMKVKDSPDKYLATKEVFLIVNQPIPNAGPSGKQRRFVQMRGVDDPIVAARVHGVELQDGRWFSQEGIQLLPSSSTAEKKYDETQVTAVAGALAAVGTSEAPAIEVVIGAGISREFGADRPDKAPVKCGEILDIGGRKWIVVGIMSTGNTSFASEVWTRDYLIQERFGKRNSYTTYVMATRDAKSALKVSKDMKEFKELAVQALPETEYYAKLTANNQQFLYSIIFVAITMAIGGVLGVMNTMFAAISQRSKDIGVMRLLGFSRWQILVSFLLESLVIAFIGGTLGCALGYLSDGLSATSIVSSGMGGGKSVILKFVVDARTIGVGFLFTLIMGSVGGLIPALTAMRLKPLESLR
jgi:ABC-type lipoprotein release transport system permease subunit